jgi:hypothetical protein
MRVTLHFVLALSFSAASVTASLAAQPGTATGGNPPSSAHGTHKPGAKPAIGTKVSPGSKGAMVDSPTAGPGVSGSGSKRDAHIKKKGNGSQASGVSAPQSPPGANSVGDTGRNAIGAKITNSNGAPNGPGLSARPLQGAIGGGDTGRSAIAAKITNPNGATLGGRTGPGTGVAKNAAMTSMTRNGASVTQGTVPAPRNAAVITGTGMGPKGAAPPAIQPTARNNTSINGTGMAGKN